MLTFLGNFELRPQVWGEPKLHKDSNFILSRFLEGQDHKHRKKRGNFVAESMSIGMSMSMRKKQRLEEN